MIFRGSGHQKPVIFGRRPPKTPNIEPNKVKFGCCSWRTHSSELRKPTKDTVKTTPLISFIITLIIKTLGAKCSAESSGTWYFKDSWPQSLRTPPVFKCCVLGVLFKNANNLRHKTVVSQTKRKANTSDIQFVLFATQQKRKQVHK